MRRGLIAAALCALLAAFCAPAAAQTLPGVDCFSPGLVSVSEALASEKALSVEAAFSVEDALYARNLSVLSEMLSGAAIRYDGFGGEDGADRLRIERCGETLLDASLSHDGAALSLNGETLALDAQALAALPWGGVDGETAALLALAGSAPIFERAPLDDIAERIAALKVGDRLPGGWLVVRAFAVTPTVSDDGARLTRIDVDGVVARAGEKPWTVSGTLRQPGGKQPKDTFELTLKQDEDNHFTLSYASTRASEITRRDQKGKATVQTVLTSDGELAGSRINSRLSVRLTNDWTAGEDGLAEKIAVTATLGHTDRTPGRRMTRLNDIAAELRAHIELQAGAAQKTPLAFLTDATLSVKLDGNDFLGGGVTAAVIVGGGAAFDAPAPEDGAQSASRETLEAAIGEAVRELASGLYAQLGERSLKEIGSGLE